MDLTTILTSIFSTAAIVGTVAFVLKRSFEKLLDARINQLQIIQKSEIEEAFRRRSALFDKRFDSLKIASSLVYRARNVARTIAESPNSILRDKKGRDLVNSLQTYQDAIKEVLFEDRALLPNDCFTFLHKQSNEIEYLVNLLVNLDDTLKKRNLSKVDKESLTYMEQRIKDKFQSIDEGYVAFIQSVKIHLGTE